MTATIEPDIVETLDPTSPDQDIHGEDGILRRVLWFGVLIMALLLVRSFLLEPVRVRSDSMMPTVPSGAVLLIDKVTLLARDPHRGEVVVADDPRTGESVIKRVVAIGGDSVGIDDGVLSVNGDVVAETYVNNDGMDGYFSGPDVVPAGHVYLLGDNRKTSEDSRTFGPVAIDDVEGRVLVTVWPP